MHCIETTTQDKNKSPSTAQFLFIVLSTVLMLGSSTQQQGKKALGWQPDPTLMCQGYYAEPRLDGKQLGLNPQQSRIRADKSAISMSSGESILSGHVSIAQINKQIEADEIRYTLNSKHQLSHFQLRGHIKIREPGRLLTATSAQIDWLHHRASIKQSFYRFAHHYAARQFHQQQFVTGLTAWGYAQTMTQLDAEHYHLHQVSYTTCSPDQVTWQLSAKHIELDHRRGRAYARDVRLDWLGWPILKSPYLSFPISNKSQSGFLTPSFGYQNRQGLRYIQPFYIYLKPNIDLTLYPQYYSLRGLGLGTELRYLHPYYKGVFYLHYLPHDQQYADTITDARRPSRAALHWKHQLDNQHGLSSQIDVNAVSDNYYLQDFGSHFLSAHNWQLNRAAKIRYDTRFWHTELRFQQLTALQLPDNAVISDTYSQLPTLSLWLDYPHKYADIDVSAQYSHFIWPTESHLQRPSGERIWLQPNVSLPGYFGGVNIIPKLSFYARHYHLAVTPSLSHITQIIPSASVEVNRDVLYQFNHHTLQQQLRAYWLWIRYQAQDKLPLFDSNYYPLTFAQLFRDNRFSGHDRVGDTMQLNLSMVNHYYRHENSSESLRISLGTMVFLQHPRVNLCITDCHNLASPPPLSAAFKHMTPLLAQVSVFLPLQLRLQSDIAYDLNQSRLEDASIHLSANQGQQHWQFMYNYQRHLIRLNQSAQFFTEPVHQLGVSSALKLSSHWHLLGTWSYNLSNHYGQTYYLGTKYDSCCWTLTIAAGRTLTSISQTRQPFYNSGVYLQLTLKGLATLSHRNPMALFTPTSSGFDTI
jgi:LPS-assembly protein